MSSFRTERVGELLRSFLSEQMQHLTDPRFQNLTITGVEVSPDLKTAWIYWSSFVPERMHPGEDSEAVDVEQREFLKEHEVKDVTAALEKVSGRLKRRIGEELELRYVPQLVFRYDSSLETGSRIDYLLAKAGISE